MQRLLLLAVALVLVSTAPGSAFLQDQKPVVVIETSMGSIKVELDPKAAPETVKNFLGYVDDKFFDGTIFHRVIPDFMIQGGGFEPGLKQKKVKDPIKLEEGLSNALGTIAMARTNDPNSATAQFFINVADNKRLDKAGGGYCAFGKVVEGMDVVNKIRDVKTGNKGFHQNVPVDDVIIKSIKKADK